MSCIFLIYVLGEAKSRFEHDDLVERGRALIEESIAFGVTHMRAFVEVDLGVSMKCLDAGIALKEEFKARCHIQICVFAQDPIFSYADGGVAMQRLLNAAAGRPGVEVFGSTPYVEENGDPEKQMKNIKLAAEFAMKHKLHLDFHIDYNLDASTRVFVLNVLQVLPKLNWPTKSAGTDFRMITFGHCTRLTLFTDTQWNELHQKTLGLPIFFVGLLASDTFMMGRPSESETVPAQRVRGTLQVIQMIKEYGLDAAIGINNVGNAFTPHGSCDPLSLASLSVGLYQAGTKADADVLFVSNSKNKIGRAHV